MGVFSDWADKYFESELSIIPVEGKRARISAWTEYCRHLPLVSTVEDWKAAYPDWNIGLCTGPANNVMAFDLDTDNEDIVKTVNLLLPPTPVTKRGKKGLTYFYKYSGQRSRPIKCNGVQIADILADGRQTVLPPSIHPETNEPYKWLGQSILDAEDLPELPETLIIEIEQALNGFDLGERVKDAPTGRNDAIKSFVSSLADRLSVEEIVQRAVEYDRACFGKNSLFSDKSEFKTTNAEINSFEFVTNILKFIMKKKGERLASNGNHDDTYPTKDSGFYLSFTNKHGKTTETPQYLELAAYAKEVLHIKSNGSAIYIYDDGYYKTINKNTLENIVTQLTKGKCSIILHLNNFIKFILVQCNSSLIQDDSIGVLNLKNGILDLKTRVLKTHTPSMFFKYKLPHEYLTSAHCPKWIEFLQRVFEGNQGLVDLSQEIFGYLISGGTPWLHRAFILYGEGRNGKSVYLRILEELVGEQNVSNIPIDKLDRPFSTVMADGKLVNICGEVTTKEIESSTFKAAVAGEKLVASQKGMPEYSLKFWAKLIFACNKKPYFRDATTGSYDRLCFIPFKRYIKDEERTRNFEETLFDELPGILNWSLDGLQKLVQRGHLLLPDEVNKEAEAYKIESDSVYAWIQINVNWGLSSQDHSGYVITDFYENFRLWCEQEYRHPVSKIEFSRRMASECKKQKGVILTYPNNLVKASGALFIAAKPIKHKENYKKSFKEYRSINEDEDLF